MEPFEIAGLPEPLRRRGDRRGHARLPCKFVALLEDATSGRVVPGIVMDLSSGGMRIHTNGPVALLDPRNLRFSFWVAGRRIRAEGRVVRFPGPRELAVAFELSASPASPASPAAPAAPAAPEAPAPARQPARPAASGHTAPRRGRPQPGAEARRHMRERVVTFHDGLERHRREQASRQNVWVSRRVASHLV